MKTTTATKVVHLVQPAAAPRSVRTPKPMGVVRQVKIVLKPSNRTATVFGAWFGAGVPLASYWMAHYEIAATTNPWLLAAKCLLVLGGLLFSAVTVYRWCKLAFGSPAKAVGFCVLAEGVLILSSTPYLCMGALAYLVVINAIATGCTLSKAG